MIRISKNENVQNKAVLLNRERLLIIGNKHELADTVDWMKVDSVNITDYQAVILDLTTYPTGYPHFNLVRTSVLSLLKNMYHVIYILPTTDLIPNKGLIFPNQISIKEKEGITTTFDEHNTIIKFYKNYVKKHKIIIHDSTDPYTFGKKSYPRETLMVNNIGEYCSLKYGVLYLLHPPQKKDHVKAIDSLVSYFYPDSENAEHIKPDWALKYELKKLSLQQINDDISTLGEQIENLAKKRENKLLERNKTAKWTDLIIRQGIILETRLIEAFKLLGVEVVEHEPNGSHGADIIIKHGVLGFTIEVEGSKKAIKITKARQLLHWMAEAPDHHKGILLGNPFRELDIKSRPPENQKFFVKEANLLAKKYRLALLPTSEIFNLVCKKLSGEDVDIDKILKKISESSGLVSLT